MLLRGRMRRRRERVAVRVLHRGVHQGLSKYFRLGREWLRARVGEKGGFALCEEEKGFKSDAKQK